MKRLCLRLSKMCFEVSILILHRPHSIGAVDGPSPAKRHIAMLRHRRERVKRVHTRAGRAGALLVGAIGSPHAAHEAAPLSVSGSVLAALVNRCVANMK